MIDRFPHLSRRAIGSKIGSGIFGRRPGRPAGLKSVHSHGREVFSIHHILIPTPVTRLTLLTQIDIFWEKKRDDESGDSHERKKKKIR